MSELTRKIVDYTSDGEAKDAREAFYSALHDKVMSHLEAHKQALASNIIAQEEFTKEAWDDMVKAVKNKNQPKPSGGAGKKQGSRYGGSKQKEDKKDE
jgi:hypothetical protein